MRRTLLLAPVLLSLAAGCGGSSTTVQQVSAKDAYLAKAEAVCASANTELAAVKKTQPTTSEALPAYVKAIVDVGRKNVEQLGALEPPVGDKMQITAKVLDPLRAQVVIGDAFTAKVTTAVQKKDPGLIGLVTNPPTQTKADLNFMRLYGFSACVKAADTANS